MTTNTVAQTITEGSRVRIVPLTRGYSALVDAEDYERVASFAWSAAKPSNVVYAVRDEKRKRIYLHRFILNAPDGVEVDHWNGDGLDNRRENLRLCSHAENVRNSRPHARGTSSYKGVHLHRASGKWAVEIQVNEKRRFIGLFGDETEAAKAYDAAARASHGEYAYCNFAEGEGAR
jgi:hypothetical protein